MDSETLTALQGSIRKWEQIVAGEIEDEGPSNCPLCQKFWPTHPSWSDTKCHGCPVYEATQRQGCAGTPYEDWEEACEDDDCNHFFAKTKKRIAAAKDELEFLRSLLPADSSAPPDLRRREMALVAFSSKDYQTVVHKLDEVVEFMKAKLCRERGRGMAVDERLYPAPLLPGMARDERRQHTSHLLTGDNMSDDKVIQMTPRRSDSDPNATITEAPAGFVAAVYPPGVPQIEPGSLGFEDMEAAFNMRDWLQRACETAGGRKTGGGFGFGAADIDIELEGHHFNVTIKPLKRG